ncbi:putative methyltransferase DDB_G0268948 [Rhodamnia argentea]|uniref:Methyltransferase DDB_G0268948 n=1 Tax=Rhodamnia argentea TaxID=178133 RepID=A0A8B8NTC7_9MYRT|nr:putative methyltransferase DDB_G0268948 [Rhodamnia argentea]XP_030525779.1 putative methyltransferase DDB_G0268948 [Rhodamnia argentea]XP_030525781.1 putative methyltransferase DDB_G0268948 [Rhodamnia argentea]
MAELFVKQAKQYAATRPSYPPQLFRFIASKTPSRDLAWDVGTGSGQAAQSLAEIYSNVVATDTSPKQLELAPKLPNVRYELTSPAMSMAELDQKISGQSSLDLVTIAQALHWFDLPNFYRQVKHVLKKPHGVIAAWCYTIPEVNGPVDSVFRRFYSVDSDPYWDLARKLVDGEYRGVDFPFEPVEGMEDTGPVRFVTERAMGVEDFFTYIRSWSAYQTAKEKGVELLNGDTVERFKRAWAEDGEDEKVVKFPVFLKIGRVGDA